MAHTLELEEDDDVNADNHDHGGYDNDYDDQILNKLVVNKNALFSYDDEILDGYFLLISSPAIS